MWFRKTFTMRCEISAAGFEVVTPNNESINIKESLAAILADTPAAHQVMGTKQGVGFAFRKCRHCLATAEEIKTKTWDEDFILRDFTLP